MRRVAAGAETGSTSSYRRRASETLDAPTSRYREEAMPQDGFQERSRGSNDSLHEDGEAVTQHLLPLCRTGQLLARSHECASCVSLLEPEESQRLRDLRLRVRARGEGPSAVGCAVGVPEVELGRHRASDDEAAFVHRAVVSAA